MNGMFETEDGVFSLRYSIGRVECIERETGTAVLEELNRTKGAFPLAVLKAYVGWALFDENKGEFAAPQRRKEIAERLIEREGYEVMCRAVLDGLRRDCDFFFRAV